MRTIDSIDQLKELARDGLQCYIELPHGYQGNPKHITWNAERDTFKIYHEADDFEEELTECELFNERRSQIGKALLMGRLKSYT